MPLQFRVPPALPADVSRHRIENRCIQIIRRNPVIAMGNSTVLIGLIFVLPDFPVEALQLHAFQLSISVPALLYRCHSFPLLLCQAAVKNNGVSREGTKNPIACKESKDCKQNCTDTCNHLSVPHSRFFRLLLQGPGIGKICQMTEEPIKQSRQNRRNKGPDISNAPVSPGAKQHPEPGQYPIADKHSPAALRPGAFLGSMVAAVKKAPQLNDSYDSQNQARQQLKGNRHSRTVCQINIPEIQNRHERIQNARQNPVTPIISFPLNLLHPLIARNPLRGTEDVPQNPFPFHPVPPPVF